MPYDPVQLSQAKTASGAVLRVIGNTNTASRRHGTPDSFEHCIHRERLPDEWNLNPCNYTTNAPGPLLPFLFRKEVPFLFSYVY